MIMQKTLNFITSLIILFVIHPALSGQGISGDSVKYRKIGPRISLDVAKTVLPLINNTRTGFELAADIEIKPAYYLVAEYGREEVDLTGESFEYASEGFFFRAGFDYNFLQKKIPVSNYEMLFGGLRYCYASFSHTAQNIIIPDNYFGAVGPIRVEAFDLNAHWLEVTGGIKGELFRNFFIGWSFRGRVMLFRSREDVMYPYFIPGFGAGNKKARLGFNYYFSYRIPLYRKPVKIGSDWTGVK
jgi:hypothetical protein